MVSPATGTACENEMMKPSPISLARQKQLAKFDCIDIWRSEVKSSRLHCMCSAAAVETKKGGPTKGGPTDSAWAVKTPSTFTASVTSASYKKLTKLATSSTSRDDDEPTPEPKPSGFGLSNRRGRSRGGCPVCSLPTDAVVYMSICTDEYGFTWAPRPLSSIKSLEQMWKSKEKKGKELLSKISPAFLRPKKLGSPQSEESTDPSDTSLDGDFPRKQNATEMYKSLRCRAGPDSPADGVEDDDKVDPLRAITHSDGKKLPVSIEDIAARLRRAKKLLDKSVASNSASKKSSINAILQPRFRSST